MKRHSLVRVSGFESGKWKAWKRGGSKSESEVKMKVDFGEEGKMKLKVKARERKKDLRVRKPRIVGVIYCACLRFDMQDIEAKDADIIECGQKDHSN